MHNQRHEVAAYPSPMAPPWETCMNEKQNMYERKTKLLMQIEIHAQSTPRSGSIPWPNGNALGKKNKMATPRKYLN